jgi:AraC family transcriptional regulator
MRTGGYDADVFKDGRHVFSRAISAGGVSLMEAGVRPRAIHHGRWQVLHLYLPAELVTTLAVDAALIASPEALELIDPQCASDPVIQRIGADVAAEMREAAPLSRLRIDTLGVDLTIQLIRNWSNCSPKVGSPRGPRATRLASWQFERVRDLLMSNLAADRSLAEMASTTRLSTFHFARAFKASTGLPPHRFLVKLRITRARELLEATNLPIGEIAAQVGYDDPSYLARLFRREVGVAPLAYRRERRR